MVVYEMRLKELRVSKGLSLDRLSQDLHINKSTLSRIENGLREPKQSFIEDCAKYFNVTIDYFLGKKEKNDIEISDKDEKDIAKTMKKLKEQLSDDQGLLFDGNILDEETSRLLLEAIEHQERMIKKINKKYTPKKYIK